MTLEDIMEQHELGWQVMLKGRRICTLKYLFRDGAFYIFKVEDINCEEETLTYILKSTARSPTEDLVYVNIADETVVKDEELFGDFREGIAHLRDYRPISFGLWFKIKMHLLKLINS